MKSDNECNSHVYFGMTDKQGICQTEINSYMLWFPCRIFDPCKGFSGPLTCYLGPTQSKTLADLLIINWSPFQCLPSLGFYFTNSLRQAGSHTLRLFFFCLIWFVYRAFWLLLFILDPRTPTPPPPSPMREICPVGLLQSLNDVIYLCNGCLREKNHKRRTSPCTKI